MHVLQPLCSLGRAALHPHALLGRPDGMCVQLATQTVLTAIVSTFTRLKAPHRAA